jgi:hypothetical protein
MLGRDGLPLKYMEGLRGVAVIMCIAALLLEQDGEAILFDFMYLLALAVLDVHPLVAVVSVACIVKVLWATCRPDPSKREETPKHDKES